MVPFDLETTGVDQHQDRPVTAYTARHHRDGRIELEQDWLINPGIPIPAEAAKVHGITDEIAQRDGTEPGPSVDSLIEHLLCCSIEDAEQDGLPPGLGRPIVGMNLAFDLTMLHADALRHGVRTFEQRRREAGVFVPVVDIYVLDKQADRYRKGKRKLVDLARVYHVPLDNAHDARADAVASVQIARKIGLGASRVVARMDLRELHHAQVGWRAQQCANLQAYFRRSGKADEVVDPCWPVCLGHAPAPEAAAEVKPEPKDAAAGNAQIEVLF